MALYVRKLFMVGGQLVVSLPAKLRRELNLVKGAYLTCERGPGRSLVYTATHATPGDPARAGALVADAAPAPRRPAPAKHQR